MIRPVLVGLAAAATLAGPGLAATEEAQVEAAVRKWASSIDAGDFKTVIEMQTPDVAITDEVPPYHWSAPGAPEAWLKSWDAYANARGINGQLMKWTAAPRIEITGDRAYAVFPGVFSYKVKGQPMAEPGHLGASLVRTSDGWRINAWTWAGEAPK